MNDDSSNLEAERATAHAEMAKAAGLLKAAKSPDDFERWQEMHNACIARMHQLGIGSPLPEPNGCAH
jgi:hypothetical protein